MHMYFTVTLRRRCNLRLHVRTKQYLRWQYRRGPNFSLR